MSDNPYLVDEKNIPANLVPAPEKGPLGAPAPPKPNDMPQFFSGSMPPSLQHDVAFVGTEVGTPGIPKHSLMPLGTQANPFTNAAATSTSKIIVQQAIAAIPTTPDIDTSSLGDGLIHGDAIWAVDSAFVTLRDEFVSGGGIGSNQIGQLGWTLPNGNAVNNTTYTQGIGLGNFGEFGWSIATGANNVGAILLLESASLQAPYREAWPLLVQPGWKAVFIWRYHRGLDGTGNPISFLHKSSYVGLAFMDSAGFVPRPNIFIGARFDTDTTAPSINDSHIILEAVQNPLTNARQNAQGTTVDTGITPAEDVYYRLEITCVATGVVTMSINGAAPSTFTLAQTSITAGAGSQVGAGNGQAQFSPASPVGGFPVWGPGASVTVAGLTGGNSGLNGTYTVNGTSGNGGDNTFHGASAQTVGLNSTTGWTAAGYPSLFPCFIFGNDTGATGTSDNSIRIDFFAFVWDKSIAGATTPTATLDRYW